MGMLFYLSRLAPLGTVLQGHASLETVMIYTEPTTEQLRARMERAERRPNS